MEDFIKILKEKAQPTRDGFKKELSGIRANRPSTVLIEDIKVSYYNEMVPVKQLGTIAIQPPRDIFIQIWDKGAIPGVAKAIESTSLGFGVTAEGTGVRVHLPELSEERREELVKLIKRLAEEHRIQIRHLRDEMNKKIQTAFDVSEINEDQKFAIKEDVQKEIDAINKEIENEIEQKTKEIKE
jgi:ribosome recycling factor